MVSLIFACFCRPFCALERLEICGGHLGDEGAKDLIWLSGLQHLTLAQNPGLGDRASLFLSGLTNLKSLNLSGTQLTGNGILPLRALTVHSRAPYRVHNVLKKWY